MPFTVSIDNSAASGNVTAINFANYTGLGTYTPSTKLRILYYSLSSDAPQSVTFYNGVTALTGPMAMASGVQLANHFQNPGLFDLSPGQSFVISFANAVETGGYVGYALVGNY